ncbi:hypothetical protein BpHYR1_001734 [Brachionus plicatilis]|uniref:Fibronectin type-III domain-containing protein n=1 Tax=Brachionus plicatilis TaxID=10195 RepID=A0A3M7QHK0_BRAPC|nr:hypothetical protein BpHYR1_001734 [Brachionus plicatilis]
MVNLTHWYKEDYFPYLSQNFKNAVLALEYLVDDLHINKEKTLEKFLNHVNKDNLIVGLVKLMASDNLRVSGNSAFVFGTIAETSEGIGVILDFLNDQSQPESKKLLNYLIKLLKSSDYECMMNAAGTIGTISENNLGRSWLISQPLLDQIIQISVELLDNGNVWVSSNAALVIARIAIEEEGCEKILNHELSSKILIRMIQSLGCDNIGRGMNCAFAIGRLCDTEAGRLAFLAINEINDLIESLFKMIESNSDNGCTKNSCYALSCLAVNQQAHQIILNNREFNNLITTLCDLLYNVSDPESQWFIAMVFSNYPSGYIKMKNIESLWKTISDISKKNDLNNDVREEINIILETLKPIEKPEMLNVTVLGPNSVRCEWKPLNCKAQLTIEYFLFKNEERIYVGPGLEYKINDLEPNTEYLFSVQALIVENNEKSDRSKQISIQTHEALPSEPENLKATGATMNIIRVVWEPPSKPNGTLKSYFVYNGEILVEQTSELSSTITGLQPESSYEISVCASNNRGKGERAYLKASTCGLGDVLPDKPSFGMIGKREILVRWQPPPVISGKLTRYDLNISSKYEKKCIYSGITTEYHVTMLRPDNEYKFEVVAITTEGKFKSKISKVRTQKDEYDPERQPLYPGPNLSIQIQQSQPIIKERNESSLERKRNSFNENSRIGFVRSKTKPKIVILLSVFTKEVLPTMLCEEVDLNQVKKLDSNSYNRSLEPLIADSSIFAAQSSNGTSNFTSSISNSKQFFPSLKHSKPSQNFKNELFSDESLIQMERPILNFYRGKTDLKRNIRQNEVRSTPKSPFTRSRTTLKMSPNLKKSDSPTNSQNFVQPTVFSFSVKDISPKFPVLPLVTTQTMPQSSCSTDNRFFQQNLLNQPPLIQNKQSNGLHRPTIESRTSNKSEKKNDGEFQLQYRYLLNRINKSKNLDDNMGHLIRSNTYVNR